MKTWRKRLKLFRGASLLSALLSGIAVTALTFLCLVLCHFAVLSCFELTVGWKTGYYYFFQAVLGGEILYFIFYPLFHALFYFRLGSRELLKRVVLFVPEELKDVFISVYHLAFHRDKVTGSEELKRAAWVQKYVFLQEHGFVLAYPFRRLAVKMACVMILFLIFLGSRNFIGEVYDDLRDYRTVYPRYTFEFEVLNDCLEVESGKDFELRMRIHAKGYSVENAFVCFGGGEFLMERKDSVFVYHFESLHNDLRFHFKAEGTESGYWELKVLPVPVLTDYRVVVNPPAYTGLKPEVQKNTVDFQVLYGSRLQFQVRGVDIDSLCLSAKTAKKRFLDLKKGGTETDFTLDIRKSEHYTLYGSNAYFCEKPLLDFTVTCVADLYPGIQVTVVQDSMRSSLYYFYGVITDDYGFSDLRFNYALDGERFVVMPVRFVKNQPAQEFYFSFDFAEFSGMDYSSVDYYFEVFDNDVLSGPKSTRSDSRQYAILDLNTVFGYNQEVNQTVNSSLSEVEKLARDIVSGVKELQHKMLDDNVDNWEKQQLSKDIMEKKEALDKLLERVKEQNLKKSDINKSYTRQDSLLLSKQQQIQDLLDQVVDDDMKRLMEEFSKLSKEFSKDNFRNIDTEMKLTFDQMSEELDRNIELLKRFQIEEQHDLIGKQLEHLKSLQEKFEDARENSSLSSDSLAAKSRELQEEAENIQKNYEKLLENNEALSEPYDLKNLKPEFDALKKDLEQQTDRQSSGKKDDSLSEEIKEELEELAEELSRQQEQQFGKQGLPENDIELIIQNILILSLSQEELLQEFPRVESQSLRYNELGRLQDLKRQEYKIVKDSLSVLARSNLMLASLLSDKFYELEIKFGLLPHLIQDNKRGELSKEQQYIVTYLNDMALSLTEALQQSREESGKKDSPSGKDNRKPSDGKGKGYEQLKKRQQGMKQQLEDLISKMKNGEKGKPFQREISNMIREHELFRKSLNDFFSESGSLTPVEKQLLNEMNRLLEDNLRDLSNYSVSRQLIQRNNLLYNKLMMSEKALKEREEFEEKRKSESAKDREFERPETIFDNQRKRGLMKTDFRKYDLKLNDYFKSMYNNYYIRLGYE